MYSGGQRRRNARLHAELVGLCARRSGLRMTYIAFCSENAATYYARFRRRYRGYGATRFHCIAADDPGIRGDREVERKLLASDVVYLAGGNTFYFLWHLRRSRLLPVLRRFAARGGVLAGLSAGALVLTPNIGLAGYPSYDRDPNDVGLNDLRALGLVRFEFFPHYSGSPRLRNSLAAYSRRTRYPIYACADGSGLVVHGDCFTAHGDVTLFDRGRHRRIGA
jgi:dipeptidase E